MLSLQCTVRAATHTDAYKTAQIPLQSALLATEVRTVCEFNAAAVQSSHTNVNEWDMNHWTISMHIP